MTRQQGKDDVDVEELANDGLDRIYLLIKVTREREISTRSYDGEGEIIAVIITKRGSHLMSLRSVNVQRRVNKYKR